MVDAETSEDVRIGNSGHRKEAMKTDTLRLWALGKMQGTFVSGQRNFLFFCGKRVPAKRPTWFEAPFAMPQATTCE